MTSQSSDLSAPGSARHATISDLIVDARALQDVHYRFRGVGQHSSSLLTALRARSWPVARPRLIGLVSSSLPPLVDEHARLFDVVRSTTFLRPRPRSVFLCLSPMTHDPRWLGRILQDRSILKVSLFYDLIQLQYPERYLASGVARAEFAVRLGWLSSFDMLASISSASRDDAARIAAFPSERIAFTGVAVRGSLEPVKNEEPIAREARAYYLMAGGGDPRKNPECAVRAHARHARQTHSSTGLHIFGSYPEDMRRSLRALYAEEGGAATRLTFLDHLDDETLRQEYRGAIASLVPSFAEGFSVPIIESSAADTPCLVSDIPAHRELVPTGEARFAPDDPDRLQALFERLESPGDDLWGTLRQAHRERWRDFSLEAVGERFVAAIEKAMASRIEAPGVLRGARPKLGILTPVPPAASGVADFSGGMVKAVADLVDVELFTDTDKAAPIAGVKMHRPLSEVDGELSKLDNVVSVIGNSHFHRGEFDFLLRHGGAAIVHDARMINFYVILLGMDHAVAVARREHGTSVEAHTVQGWILNQQTLPILFLSEIVGAASPAFVHSPTTATLIRDLYKVEPHVLPFAQYTRLGPEYATEERRRWVRGKYEIGDSDFLVASFGFVAPDKAPDELIWAIKLLRDWKVPAKLVFCGDFVSEESKRDLTWLVADLDMADHVRFSGEVVDTDTYKALLFAAEAAVQLRTYFMGGLSGALNDCIAAGLPCVANDHLAAAMEAPGFVRRVPDSLSPLLVAEALLDIVASGQGKARPMEEARAFAQTHSFETYAKALVQNLGFAVQDRHSR